MNNASTREDVTNYFAVVPSNHLERLLWAEAERMQNLDVVDANFKSERAVVQEEYRQRVLASPYGRFYEVVRPSSYTRHPYRRGVIGNIAELDAASLDDVRAFHRTFYRPDNAMLIVAGDFDPKQLDAWVDKYFAPIARPSSPIPRVTAVEPARTKDARYKVTGPNVPLPAVALTWLGPPASSPDAAALKVAAAILGNGESSRLNQALVYRGQIAQTASFGNDMRVDPGLLIAYAVAAKGVAPDALVKALRAEIERARAQARARGRAREDQDPAPHPGARCAANAARQGRGARGGDHVPRRRALRESRARRPDGGHRCRRAARASQVCPRREAGDDRVRAGRADEGGGQVMKARRRFRAVLLVCRRARSRSRSRRRRRRVRRGPW